MKDEKVSKALAYLLRHGAQKESLPLRTDGFARVHDILARPNFNTVSFAQIRDIVSSNDKQRFTLREIEDQWYIRANQGHSMKDVSVDLVQVHDSGVFATPPIHGTTMTPWQTIRKEGLKPMRRQHVHMAKGMVGEDDVISGMRKSCTVFIYIDVARAMEDGMKFFVSSNGVILSSGIDGVIAPKYFAKVVDRQGNDLLGGQEVEV